MVNKKVVNIAGYKFVDLHDRDELREPLLQHCEELGIKLLWSIGGDEKLDSSSELAKKARDFKIPKQRSSGRSSDR